MAVEVEFLQLIFPFDNNKFLRNIFSTPVALPFHIQNNEDEFLYLIHAMFLFYKKDQTRLHNPVDREHQDKQYGRVVGLWDN
jgi:hypothetical protein